MIEGTKIISNRHWKHKERACDLRSQGWSYKEIMKEVPVAKSTISLWCRDVPMSQEQRRSLSKRWDTQRLGIKAIQKMFWKRRCDAFEKGVKMASTVRDDAFVAGVMIHWAEGNKKNNAGIANSDARVIKMMVVWFEKYFLVKKSSLAIHLHLHSGQNEENMKKYWSRVTGVPLKNFSKSFVKPEGSGYRKNILYNGTVKLTPRGPGSTYLLFTILGCIAGYLERVIDERVNIEEWIQRLPYA